MAQRCALTASGAQFMEANLATLWESIADSFGEREAVN